MKVAVIGLGNMGSKILPAIRQAPEVSAIAGFDPDLATAARARENGVEVAPSLEALLADPALGLVFIAAPNHLHCELAIAALEAGKAVLCEKPMATTLADCERMVSTAERLGGFLQIGFELRYSKLYRCVKERIEAGLIGRVVNTQCTYICSEFHGRHSWRNQTSSGGGMFGEKLCHYVDLPRWWLNEPVVEVRSICAPNVVPYYEVRDNYHTTLQFDSGAVSHLTFMMAPASTLRHDPLQNHISMHADDGHELRYLICGTQGVIETSVFQRRLRRWSFSNAPEGLQSQISEELTWPATEADDYRYVHNTTDQTLDVIARVAAGQPPHTEPRDSLETMRIVFAADDSADNGGDIIRFQPNPALTSLLPL